ncbi:MAG: hypothetical protein N2379_01975 [Verrucomicrobiae bacterium]|nr:hypothetical protein [Verrucomicrobiae bacterium]
MKSKSKITPKFPALVLCGLMLHLGTTSGQTLTRDASSISTDDLVLTPPPGLRDAYTLPEAAVWRPLNTARGFPNRTESLIYATAESVAGGGNESEAGKVPAYRPFTFAVEAGTTGPGVVGSWRFLGHLGLRAGLHYFSYSADDIEIEGINFGADLRLMWMPIGLDLYPSKNSSFRLTVGAVLNRNEFEGSARARDNGQTIEIGESIYDLQDIGGLSLELDQQTVCPYMAIGGNLYLGRAKRWSLMGELGVIYTDSPEVRLAPGVPGSVSEADLRAEIQEIEDVAKNFKFWPVIKFGLCFSF